MNLEFKIGQHDEHTVRFSYNQVLSSVEIHIDDQPFYRAVQLTGTPNSGTKGMCPGEAEIEETVSARSIAWSFSVNQIAVRITRKARQPFGEVRRHDYTVEVDGIRVLARQGF